jgi:hypothetical protein
MVHSECLIPILISGSLMLYDFISCYMVHLSNLFLFSLLVRSFVYESITRGCLILIICFSVIDMVSFGGCDSVSICGFRVGEASRPRPMQLLR